MAFKKGDVVELKSGSPRLTVESIEPSGLVRACWYQDAKFLSYSFSPEMLTSPEKSSPSVIETDTGNSWV